MKIVNPNNETHTIKLIPRFYTDEDVQIIITNETTKEATTITINDITYSVSNGIVSLTFDFDFTDKQKYSIKVIRDVELDVFYRGKIFATTQETQDYKLTTGLYFYE